MPIPNSTVAEFARAFVAAVAEYNDADVRRVLAEVEDAKAFEAVFSVIDEAHRVMSERL